MHSLFLVIFVCIGIYQLIIQKGLKRIFILLALILYLSVFVLLNQNVKNASTHGNTIHGWYSKYNTTEKFIAVAWVIGFPLTCFIVAAFLSSSQQKKDSEKSREIDTGSAKTTEVKSQQKINDISHRVSTALNINPQKPNHSKIDHQTGSIGSIKVETGVEGKVCPKCGSEMVIRVAKKGKFKGRQFWGCKKFPSCRSIVNIDG